MLRMLTTTQRMSVQQSTTDVFAWDTYFAPDDNIHDVLLAELQRAVQVNPTPEVHSSQYGFTDPDIAVLFAKLGKLNQHSRFLFDKTQEAGHVENPIVKSLCNQLGQDQWAIGTSPVRHEILHTKAVVILYGPDQPHWTMTGSFNLSASAQDQFNIVDVTRSNSRGKLFAARIDAMFNWVKSNQGGNTP